MKNLSVKSKEIQLPIFLPDGTRGVVRSVDSKDLVEAGVEGMVVNTYHLLSEPGVEVITKAGGIGKLMNFDGLFISDSGGFQVLSLIYKDKTLGKITDEGVTFNITSTGEKKKTLFTPEQSIHTQFDLNADILICLDDCPAQDADEAQVEKSVKRTIEWAKRCKDEYLKQIEQRKLSDEAKPLLFGVIQGGSFKDLRQYCAEELIKIGFDGYGFGGWPVKDGEVDLETLEYTASLMPEDKPKYALGVGDPKSVVECTKMGYNIFDCVLPTRDARHHRLYLLTNQFLQGDQSGEIVEYLYINKTKFSQDLLPISSNCDCFTCQNYARGYLHHLFKIGDGLSWRLATIHNLRVYTRLIEVLRGK